MESRTKMKPILIVAAQHVRAVMSTNTVPLTLIVHLAIAGRMSVEVPLK